MRSMAKRKRTAEPVHELGDLAANLRLPDLRPLLIAVAGEVILDRYVWGDVERISPEAPIPVLHVHRREEKPGNAGFVMANLRALGALPLALSVIGNDRNGLMLREILHDIGIDTRGLIIDADRPTIVKERMLGSVQSANRATQQLLRIDEEDVRPLAAPRERMFKARIVTTLKRADALLIADINKGLLTPGVLRTLIDTAKHRSIPVVIDPRMSHDYSIYLGATALTPNRHETELATGIKLTDRHAWRAAAELLIKKLDLQACLITLDRDGMYLAERGGQNTYIATAPRDVYDVTGAGDVVLIFFGYLIAAGLGLPSAAKIANLAAGIEVGRLGTEIISSEDLARALRPAHQSYEAKILSSEELALALDRERRAGRKIVFTNGCFDLLHAGHLHSLGFAHAQGDVLVVGVNSDHSVSLLKGPDRPIHKVGDRARLLAGLEMVDYVTVFDDTRAEGIIRRVRPDVLIKGEDYRGKLVDGQKFVEAYGGRVVLAPLLEGHSTSATITRMRAAEAAVPRAPAALSATRRPSRPRTHKQSREL